MKVLNKNFIDKRGYILDILYNESFNHATLIHSNPKSIRGNHYHKKTTQITFILSGEVEYYFKIKKSKIKKFILVKNSFLITKPHEIHAYKFIKKTKMLILSKGLRGGKDYEKDTYRKKII
tara:strand:+ start:1088 stop:1450 length:363 start_codon:yes stop_codon:yes gene_type:complete